MESNFVVCLKRTDNKPFLPTSFSPRQNPKSRLALDNSSFYYLIIDLNRDWNILKSPCI